MVEGQFIERVSRRMEKLDARLGYWSAGAEVQDADSIVVVCVDKEDVLFVQQHSGLRHKELPMQCGKAVECRRAQIDLLIAGLFLVVLCYSSGASWRGRSARSIGRWQVWQ